MNNQNIYDNDDFFAEYKKLRENAINYNRLLEQPAMRFLLPSLSKKTVLDLGCGFGQNCREFISLGAKSVLGIDISEKMLAVAMKENAHENIEYLRENMTTVSKFCDKFDLIYSSLAFHYIEDFDALCSSVYRALKSGGTLLFSQEHPIVTATKGGNHFYLKEENGTPYAYAFSDYAHSGERKIHWFVDGVIKYHRRFSDIINSLVNAGFTIDKVLEPYPNDEACALLPKMKKESIKPSFLIIRAIKK